MNELIKQIAAALKKRKGKIDPADFSSNYQTAVDIAQQIAVHSKSGNFPEKLMRAKAPNETSEELDYRRDNFEPITKPYWDRGLASINRIWAEQNYSVLWGSDEVKHFFTKCFPVYGSLLAYFKTVLTPYKINDANAVLVIDIGEIPLIDNGDGTVDVDQSKALSPLCKIYSCDKVLFFDKDEHCLLLADEKSKVRHADNYEHTGYVLYYLDTTSVYRIEQTGDKNDYRFTTTLLYEHNLGYLPAKRLGGKQLSESQGNDVISESYFMPAIPYLNKALKLDSTLDISINKMAYPIRSYYEAHCTNPTCTNGKITVYDPMHTDSMLDGPRSPKTVDCPVCGGTGKSISFSPMRDYVHTPRGGFNNEEPVPFPGFAYISPDPTILRFNQEKITSDIERAFMFLNINVSLQAAGGDNTGKKTATQSKIDREELFSFLLIISEEVFGLLKFAVDTICRLRYPGNEPQVIINPPVQFDIRDVDELTTEIAQAQTNNVPDIIRRELTKEYMMLRFPAQKGLEKLMDIIFYCDPLAAKTTQDVILLRQQNLVSQTDAILHEHIFYFIEQKLNEDAAYLGKDMKLIKQDMLGLAGEKVV